MKRFFRTIIRSITDLEFYHQTLETLRLQTLLLQYGVFLVLVGAIAALHWNITRLPKIEAYFRASLTHTVETLPEDFQLDWSGSELQSTPGTVVISYPEVWEDTSELPDTLLVVQTDETATRHSALFTVTSQDVVIWQPEGPYNQPLSGLFDSASWQVSKQDIDTFSHEMNEPLSDAVLIVTWLSPILLILGLFVKRAVQLLFAAALLSLFSSYASKSYAFTESLKLLSMLFIPAEIITRTHSMLTASEYSLFSLSVLSYYLVILWTKPHPVISR